MARSLTILTNFARIDSHLPFMDGISCNYRALPPLKLSPKGLREMHRLSRGVDYIIINCDLGLTLIAALLKSIPFLGMPPLIAVDPVLGIPEGIKLKVLAAIKKFLLLPVDLFINYFSDVSHYAKFFGVTRARSEYTPFKSNIWNDPKRGILSGRTGKYVFSAGRSFRDYDSYMKALAKVSYPGAVLFPGDEILRSNGSVFSKELVPPNCEIIDDTARSPTKWLEAMAEAKVVVVPTLKKSINAVGISTYLDAMALGKAVIVSEGPGSLDIPSHCALFVPPEDPDALAKAITELWENDVKREAIARNGARYIESLGGEKELYERVLRIIVKRIPRRGI